MDGKKIEFRTTWKSSLPILIAMILGTGAAAAVDKVTATVAITNAAGTTNGQTITVNGDVRTWTNNVVVSSVQIATNATPTGAKTNMYAQFGLNPFSQVVELDAGSTNIQLVGNAGVTLTVTLSAGWGSVSYSTQSVSELRTYRVPSSAEAAAVRTNNNSYLMAGLRDPSDTNQFYESDFQVANLVGITNNQAITGKKDFNNGYGSYNGALSSYAPLVLLSSGSNSVAEIRGVNAGPSTNRLFSTPAGWSFASPIFLGGNLTIGIYAINGLNCSINSNGFFGAGYGVTNVSGSNVINGALIANVSGSNVIDGPLIANISGTNLVAGSVKSPALATEGLRFNGTNTFAADADIAFTRKALSTLANGINQDVIVGTNTFIEVSGPSGAFSIEGLTGSPNRDGKFVIILNQTGQNMTIAAEGGATGNDPVAANRILTMTGADRATTGNGATMLIYSAAVSRWILISFDP